MFSRGTQLPMRWSSSLPSRSNSFENTSTCSTKKTKDILELHSILQVGQILRTMGQAFEERDLKQLIKEFDTDGSGEIEFEEFAAMVANFVVNSEDNEGLEEELREAFRLYDKQVRSFQRLNSEMIVSQPTDLATKKF
ncbi:EF hand [Ancylostoma ceylanicum]|uniref:EF hand n=1 Tax=Ancylostoma ceylanicum TaxID=53326 RepID=A0A0D6LRJ6_9BILA|nr:EF hand [Ancylostoma ceylanicum]